MLDSLQHLLPLIGGGLFGALMTLWSNSQQDKADAHKRTMEALSHRENSNQDRNEMVKTNKGFAWTRRIIALSLISVIVGAFYINGDVTVPITVTEGGSYFFGLIDTTSTKQVYETMSAPLILPEVLDSCQAIIGAYFGNSMVKRN